MIVSLAVLSQYTCVTNRRQTDRRHLVAIAELAMQLQRSAKNYIIFYLVLFILFYTYFRDVLLTQQ